MLVRDGPDTCFWIDTWVDGEPLLSRSHTPIPVCDLERTVRSYVDDDGDWDWSSVRKYLSTSDCMRLVSILPPSDGNGSDRVAWKGEKDNIFSVSYCVVQAEYNQPSDKIWSYIWKWQGPQRFKTCLWLIANDKLLTHMDRCKRNMKNDTLCPIGNQENESILHAVRDCPRATSTWKLLVHPADLHRFFNMNHATWLSDNLQCTNMSPSLGEIPWSIVFVVCVWSLWRERNNVIFRDHHRDPQQIFHGILNQSQEIIRSNMKLAKVGVGKTKAFIGWKFPQAGWTKCNVDGACKNYGESTGCGGAMRDSSGQWLMRFKQGLVSGTVLNAELWGILQGMKLTWNQGVRKLWIEGDSMTVVNLVKKGCGSFHQHFNLVQEILKYCNKP